MANIILDTNVISEVTRQNPGPFCFKWYKIQTLSRLYLTSLTIAELWQGVMQINEKSPKRPYYLAMTAFIESQYEGRVLPFDRAPARIWGGIRGRQKRAGKIMPVMDMQIAAIALHHGMSVATGNTRHFAGLGIDLVNPFES